MPVETSQVYSGGVDEQDIHPVIVSQVSGEDGLWLLPVNGSDTQWYRNLMKNRAITIHAGSKTKDSRAKLLKDPSAVSADVEQFREKYTPGEIKRWYKGLDVAVEVPFAV
jgi:hypothetical protein